MPAPWATSDDYARFGHAAAAEGDIVIGNEEEVEAAAGDPDGLLAFGVRTLVLKRGEAW